MAQLTPGLRALHAGFAELIPAPVVARIDQAELLDRFAHATCLMSKAATAGDAVLRQAFVLSATAALQAPPREAAEREAAGMLRRADALGETSAGDGLRRRARELLEATAPRQAGALMAKAAAGIDLVPVYDAHGALIGVAPAASVTALVKP